MRNVLLSGVGGQGTVLAAKVLAQAAQDKGWQVRTAETIGMAQRGGNVVSHVRMGDAGEEVFAPLLAEGTADLVIAFEPAEAARVLPFLAPDGLLVTATTAIQPVTAALSDKPYRADNVLASIERSLAGTGARFVAVDDVGVQRRGKAEDDRGGVAAGVGYKPCLSHILAVEFGQTVHGFGQKPLAGVVCAVPAFVHSDIA